MPRYKLIVEYDGTPFCGWQKTPGMPTVQAALEEAIFRFCGERVTPVAAGRTDSGVHAAAQVVHVDLTAPHDPFRVMSAINFHIATHDARHISLRDVSMVDEAFHARFSARARHYRYRILNRRAPAALEANRVWHIAPPLNREAMREAALCLVGEHDFTSFRATECQAKSPIKKIDALTLSVHGEEIHIDISARSFLHHMVRNITGTLVLVGKEKWVPQDVAKALAARNRTAAGPTAPPQGLCFMRVEYDERDNIIPLIETTTS